MFQEPQFSGSTDGIWVGETSTQSPYSNSQVVAPAGAWCPGGSEGCLDDNAYEISFAWRDPTDTTTAGVRCTTSAALNLNRPSLHLDGTIRFKMAVTAFSYEGDVDPDFPIGFQDTSGHPSILMCLAIIETGRDLPQGTADTSGGDIEYVYLPLSEVIPAADSNGMGSFPPGGKRFSATSDLWPPEDGVFYNVEIDLSAVTAAQLRGFANNTDGVDTAGDGMLDATSNPTGHGVNRGVLESIIFTNDPADDTGGTPGEYFFIYIDDVEFESPVEDPTPPPTIVAPILRNDATVTVEDISTNATQIKLKVDNGTDPDQIVNTTGVTSWEFTLPHGAIAGDIYTATQTVDGLESSDSVPVPVTFPGPFIGRLPADGDTTVRVVDINLAATEVELFVDGASRGTTAVSNQFEATVPTGTPLAMGEEVYAIQLVDGAFSDISHTVTVTTNGVTTVFCDDFEYADQTAFNAVWGPNTGDTQLQLSTAKNATPVLGTSKAAYSDLTGSGVNANQSILLNDFGPVVATDTHPVIWNVSFYDAAFNTVLFRQWAELRGVGGAADPIIVMGKTNSISGNYYTGRAYPNVGYFTLSDFNQPQRSNGWHVLTAAIKSNTIDFYVDGNLAAADVAHGVGQQIASMYLGSGLSSAGGEAWYDDVCVQVGALSFNSITTQPPTVVGPIIPGDMAITVVDIDTSASAVTLHLNGSDTPVVPAVDPMGADTVVINLASPAVGGTYYTAKQTVDGLPSSHSEPVTVLLPGPTLYKAPADGETSVRVLDLNTNASVVEVLVGGVVRGSVSNPGVDDVDVPLSSYTLSMGETVTARMTVGGTQSVESDPETVTTGSTINLVCDTFESYADQAAFIASPWTPTSGDVYQTLNLTQNATPGGAQSLYAISTSDTRVEQTHSNAVPTPEQPVVLTAAIYDPAGGGAGNQWVDADGFNTDFFLIEVGMSSCCAPSTAYYNLRINGHGGPNWIDLDQFDGPTRSIGWHQFTVVHKGNAVDAYVDGLLAAKNIPLTGTTTFDTSRIGSGLGAGNEAYYDDYCLTTGPVRFEEIALQPPTKPAITAPIEAGDTTVTITNVGPDATSVVVYANNVQIGSITDPMGTNGTVVVPVTTLVHLDSITADQTNGVGTSLPADALEVGIGNGDIQICIGIRETNDVAALGSTGGTSGQIEWVSSGTPISGAPQGEALSPAAGWVTYEFDPATDPIASFTGDGTITAVRGVLEHLAVSVDSASPNRSSGAYTMYVDNVVNVGAGTGGADFVIEDFESNTPGDEVLFQEPTLSGSTFPADLAPLPSASEVTTAQASSGLQSAILRWFWKDTTAERWARITTSGANFRSRPIIDLTKPIRMDVLLVPSCLTVPGDMDGDGDVDLMDVDEIVSCLDGPTMSYASGCECADLNGDLTIDLADYAVLQGLLAP